MKPDEQIKLEGMKALMAALGDVEAERFVALMLRARFDYTKWQEKLWPEKTIAEISRAAMDLRAPR
ncbi:MAG: hypothetical protein GY719_39405 [bacterium]|nr:hypothetical protein [bacterium]